MHGIETPVLQTMPAKLEKRNPYGYSRGGEYAKEFIGGEKDKNGKEIK